MSSTTPAKRAPNRFSALYATAVLFALTQGPILYVWWGRPRDEGIPVRAAIIASYLLVQLPALWMLASSGRLRGHVSGALRWFFLLIAWLVVSVLWATLSSHTVVEVVLLAVTVATGLWLATRFRAVELLWVTWWAMQAGVAVSLFAIWRQWPSSVGRLGEWVGIYFNRNSLAPPAAVGLIASIWLFARLVRRTPLAAATLGLVAVIDGYVLVRTGSETLAVAGAIALLVSIAAWWRWSRPDDRIGLRLWTAVATGLVVVPWTFTFGVRLVGGWLGVARIGGREGLWLFSFDGFWQRPWFGWGWLSAWQTPKFFPREFWTWWRELGGTWSHSGYFDILLGGGLVAFVLFVGATLGALLGHRSAAADPVYFGFVALVLAAMTQESFFIGSHFLTVLLVAGLFSPRFAPAGTTAPPTGS